MIDAKIEEFLKEGKLREEKAPLEAVEGLVREAVIDLDEARKTQEIGAHRATFFLAYMAMLRAGRAFLLFHGFRPANCSRHKTIVSVTSVLMGGSHKDITEHFEMALQKQMDLVHGGGSLLSELEAHDTFHYAMLLVREVVKDLKQKDPAFHVAT
jgi:uncharacterized protein (UPF0332 family)